MILRNKACSSVSLTHRSYSMSDPQTRHTSTPDTSHLEKINLTEAIQLIRHAGYPDPSSDTAANSLKVLQGVIDTLCTLSMHDGLTGLSNLRYFQIALKRETHRAARDGTPCVLLMLDIDHFKTINDRHGHPAGDQILKTVAKRLKQGLRPGDTLSRYGGEEFAIILPNCPLKNAICVAERLRRGIAAEKFPIDTRQALSVSVSIGAAQTKAETPPDPGTLLKSADENLYKAKALGRNQCYYEKPVATEVSSDEKSALFRKDPAKKSKADKTFNKKTKQA